MRDDIETGNKTPLTPEEWGPGYHLWESIRSLLAQRGPEGTTSLVRMASHLVVILVAVTVLWVSRVQLPNLDVVEAVPDEAAEIVEIDAAEIAQVQPAESEVTSTDAYALQRAAVPITLIPERPRLDIITHTVKVGDTLYGIAQRYKLNAETIVWANKLESNPDLLRVGQALAVLPINGVYHSVVKGDTLDKIAKGYKVTPAAISGYAWNALDPKNPTIRIGQKLIVPGGRKPEVVKRVEVFRGQVPAGAKKGFGKFVWPTAGYISQGYKSLHRAIDIARATGTPVKASDNGYVVVSGWNASGYGNHIVIDHGNGFQTLYAHLDRIFVRVGDVVGQGAVIGNMGTTGRSTGPHLHFEIRQNGVQRNPYSYLP